MGNFRSTNTDARGSIDKTITILRKVWLTVPSELESLRVQGLELLNRLPQRDHLPIHWGMVTAVYPFWSEVAAQTGRLLRLQGLASAAQVQRRIREQYGERETVSRAARRVLRSYLDWGVLQGKKEKGVYEADGIWLIDEPGVIAWLFEALLRSRKDSVMPLKELFSRPDLFPFRIKSMPGGLLAAGDLPGIEIFRQGLDEELVTIKV